MIEEPEDVTLYIGDYYATSRPTRLHTAVGSCIAVCLFDPMMRLGGMNHFMLPDLATGNLEPGKLGVSAMELLIEAIEEAGGKRSRLVARVFGGGHVIGGREHDESVPSRNIAFVHQFLSRERMQVRTFEVGGNMPRRLTFETWTGHARSQHLSKPWDPKLGG